MTQYGDYLVIDGVCLSKSAINDGHLQIADNLHKLGIDPSKVSLLPPQEFCRFNDGEMWWNVPYAFASDEVKKQNNGFTILAWKYTP